MLYCSIFCSCSSAVFSAKPSSSRGSFGLEDSSGRVADGLVGCFKLNTECVPILMFPVMLPP
ncbi:Uncharacterised protein [Chlamydia trachomatis]|nr:Uncharacterised protein [Chlamydia trachomatis]